MQQSYDAAVLINSADVDLQTTAAGADLGEVTGSHPNCRDGAVFTFDSALGTYTWP